MNFGANSCLNMRHQQQQYASGLTPQIACRTAGWELVLESLSSPAIPSSTLGLHSGQATTHNLKGTWRSDLKGSASSFPSPNH